MAEGCRGNKKTGPVYPIAAARIRSAAPGKARGLVQPVTYFFKIRAMGRPLRVPQARRRVHGSRQSQALQFRPQRVVVGMGEVAILDKHRPDKRPAETGYFSDPLKFLKGEKDLPCTAWGNPTYNVSGWKGPCYLITDAHWERFDDLMSQTPWERYGRGADERCEHCMVHCGYEPTAALGVNSTLGDSLRMAAWALAS